MEPMPWWRIQWTRFLVWIGYWQTYELDLSHVAQCDCDACRPGSAPTITYEQ